MLGPPWLFLMVLKLFLWRPRFISSSVNFGRSSLRTFTDISAPITIWIFKLRASRYFYFSFLEHKAIIVIIILLLLLLRASRLISPLLLGISILKLLRLGSRLAPTSCWRIKPFLLILFFHFTVLLLLILLLFAASSLLEARRPAAPLSRGCGVVLRRTQSLLVPPAHLHFWVDAQILLAALVIAFSRGLFLV